MYIHIYKQMKVKTMAQKRKTGRHILNLTMPMELFTNLKRFAEKRGVSVSSLIRDAITEKYGGEK